MTEVFKTQQKMIPVKYLSVVWRSAQRPFNPKKASVIASTFDPDKFGSLIVSLPDENGIHHVIEGQHRAAAIHELWGEDEQVPCDIVNARTPQRCAELFDAANNDRTPVNAIDKFNVRVTAGSPDHVEVLEIVHNNGFKIGSGRDAGNISAVEALLYVYRLHGGSALSLALRLIQASWGMDRNAVVANLIRGMGELAAAFPKLNQGRLVQAIKRKRLTPGQLIDLAKTNAQVITSRVPEEIKKLLVLLYNKGATKEQKLNL